jgi:precorrin-3B C17-methyltransferase
MTGVLQLVSVGPGLAEHITASAESALKASDAIVGYELYLKWIEPWIAGKEIRTTPLTQERERVLIALDFARAGKTVSLVSSGDIGVYAMAALAFDEMQETDTFELKVIPGVTAANACASLLGAPLSHDFATLSLSDLLCPWQWIQERARRIAQADLAVALYNVQSKQRQDGVYEILEIMLEHKSADTVCGVVRNAYRPEQMVDISTLGELTKRQFDMLTTVVIGNRFTRRKRNWIFTPRGYNNWSLDPPAAQPNSCRSTLENEEPHEAVWVFSGTSDGNSLARAISESGRKVVVSVATSYGEELAVSHCPGIHVTTGKHGFESRKQRLRDSKAKFVVDATHPYACKISKQLIEITSELSIPYIRYERPSQADTECPNLCATARDAARRAMELGRRIFLSTGSKDLATFLNVPGASSCTWYVRVTPDSESIEKVVELGIPRERICAMQGPFSQEFNEVLWRAWKIDCVVTKDSGAAGGYAEKLQAAASLNIPLVVIARPPVEYPRLANDFSSLFSVLQDLER